ncbi:acyltransferase family protein [Rosistilla carotiformis]|uniref:acyltransferase n=1 Tax=Rosistilla carotiformis TaxID=2528017 RepID=UPI0011A4B878|nr:acyltransferase [Rosistilla carotiformis]
MGMVSSAIAFPETRGLVWMAGSDGGGEAAKNGSLFFVLTTCIALPFAIRTVHQPSSAWDRWLGDLSFPLYLFHWIPRDWYYANVDWSLGSMRNGGLLIANFAFAFGGAILLLQFVDRPVQRWRQRWVRGRGEELSITHKYPQEAVT